MADSNVSGDPNNAVDLSNWPWTILQGAAGIPNPAKALTQPNLGNWTVGSLLPPDITNGQPLIPYNDPAWQATNFMPVPQAAAQPGSVMPVSYTQSVAPSAQSFANVPAQSAPPAANVNQWLAAPQTMAGPSSTSAGTTAAGLALPAQPLSPQIIAQSVSQPAPSLDQIAMSPPFNFSSQSLGAIHSAAQQQVATQAALNAAATTGAIYAAPEGLPREIVHGAATIADLIKDPLMEQHVKDTYNAMLQKQLNDAILMRTNNGQLPQGNLNR